MVNKRKKRFINPHIQHIRRSFWDVVRWKMGRFDDPYPAAEIPASFTYPIPNQEINAKAPKVKWINHSTFLIQTKEVTILTDPIWSRRCSPLTFMGPKRRHPPAAELRELPKIDYVFISHNHYDHLDLPTVKALHTLYPQITWLVPHGVKKWFEKQGISNVFELAWWEQHEDDRIQATAVPAQHFSGRSGRDLNQTLWLGWVIEFKKSNKRLYFVGDTGYNPHDFKKIGEMWKRMDLSLIPIGAYIPRTFMSPVHVEPFDAVKIHQEVNSALSIAMHWKTFRLADEPLHQPPYDLFLAMQEQGLDPHTFLALEPGHEINW